MATSKRHSRPFTISSDDWVLLSYRSSSSSPHSQVLSLSDLSESQLAAHFNDVLRILAKVFAMAKLVQVLFLAYGVEVRTSLLALGFQWLMMFRAA